MGIASKVASVVPMAAIATVSAVRCRNSGHFTSSAGGHAVASQWPSFGSRVARRPPVDACASRQPTPYRRPATSATTTQKRRRRVVQRRA